MTSSDTAGNAPREDNLAVACAGEFGPGENLLEVWVVEAQLDSKYFDQNAHTFMMVDFFDFESQPTQLEQGLNPKYDFSSTFKVEVKDFFIQHLLKETVTIELNIARHADFQLVASCRVPLHALLKSTARGTKRATNCCRGWPCSRWRCGPARLHLNRCANNNLWACTCVATPKTGFCIQSL